MRRWWIGLWLIGACLAQPAASQSPSSGYVIGPELSGAFYDPAQNGHGFVVQHTVANGHAVVLVTWFTYLGGEQRWLIGLGTPSGNEVRIPLVITRGGQFPPAFAASQVQQEPWGELVLRFDSRDAGRATWSTNHPGFRSGSMPLQRLSQPASGYESVNDRVAACHGGSWYNPEQSGHGLFVEVLGSGSTRTMLAFWYTYLNGAQRWLIASGPISGNRAILSASITSGADFPPNFSPGQVQQQPWGTLEFAALDENRATLNWSSSLSGFGSGSLPLTRLTALSGSDCGPTSDAKAARFLTQATFGPTPAAVADVRQRGFEAWIEEQRALPPTLHRPVTEERIAAAVVSDPRNAPVYRSYRIERWWEVALTAPDQLRQRMAYALSHIFVVSDLVDLDGETVSVAEYQDILVRNALGNYRDLLRDVTYSPAMGIFLTYLRNQKTDWTIDRNGQLSPSLISPDENYAREVMQLFSIGLIQRKRDFSPVTGGNGQPLPTYDQNTITQHARALTGLAYRCSGPATIGGITLNRNCNCTGTNCNFSTNLFFATPPRYAGTASNGMVNVTALVHPDRYLPLVCYPRYADTGRSATASNNYAVLPPPHDRKRLISGLEIPPSGPACHTGTTGADQQACIDYCNGQIQALLDALFNHPNTAPMMARQLIQRLTTSNPSPGYIERVAAVFENDGQGRRGNLGAVARAILLDPEARTELPAAHFGKLREPVLVISALWRAIGVARGSTGYYVQGGNERVITQRPLGAASVFNFFEPDYQQPGAIADAGLYSPEFQILDESTAISGSDALNTLVFAGYSMPNATTTNFTTPAGGHLPASAIDALPAGHAELIETLNQRLLYGRMTPGMRARLQTLLDGPMAGADRRRKALNLIHLILISPEFMVQR